MPPKSTSPQLSRELATLILDRAAALDSEDKFELSGLRSAAADAGISQEAFDRALAEMVARQDPSRQGAQRSASYETAFKALGIGALGGTVAIALASILLGSPTADVLGGAIVGAGGALAAVVAYLLRRHREIT